MTADQTITPEARQLLTDYHESDPYAQMLLRKQADEFARINRHAVGSQSDQEVN